MNKTLKTIFIIVILAAVVYFAVTFISSNNNSAPESGLVSTTGTTNTDTLTSNPVGSDQVGREFLSQLLNLQSIDLDDSILVNPAYQALEDFTITLRQPGDEGRDNPFAPIGVDSFSQNSQIITSSIPTFATEDTILETDDFSIEDIDAEIQLLQDQLDQSIN
jgi:FlaG/FlaF family flagellin (archaellin)